MLLVCNAPIVATINIDYEAYSAHNAWLDREIQKVQPTVTAPLKASFITSLSRRTLEDCRPQWQITIQVKGIH